MIISFILYIIKIIQKKLYLCEIIKTNFFSKHFFLNKKNIMKQFLKILLYIIYYYITKIKSSSETVKYIRINENTYFTINNSPPPPSLSPSCSIKQISMDSEEDLPCCFFLSGTYQDPRLIYDYKLEKPIYLISYSITSKEIHILTFDTNIKKIIRLDSRIQLSQTLEIISNECAVVISSKLITPSYVPGLINYEHTMLFINLTNQNIGKQVILISDDYFINSVFFSLLKMNNGLLLLTSFNCLGNYDPINDEGILIPDEDVLEQEYSISFFFVNLTTYSIERKSFFDVEYNYRYKEKEMKMIELTENGISYIILCYYFEIDGSHNHVMCYSQKYMNDNLYLSNKDISLYFCDNSSPFHLYNISNIGFIGCKTCNGYEIKKFYVNLTTIGYIPPKSDANCFIPFTNTSIKYFEDNQDYYVIPECEDNIKISIGKSNLPTFSSLIPKYLPDLGYYINILNFDSNSGITNDFIKEYCLTAQIPLNNNIESKEISFEYNLFHNNSIGTTINYYRSKNCIGKILICFELCNTCDKIGNLNNHNCKTCIETYSFNQSNVTGNCILDSTVSYYKNNMEMIKCYKTCYKCKNGGDFDKHNCIECNKEKLYYPLYEDLIETTIDQKEINCYYLFDKMDYYYFDSMSQSFKKCKNGCKVCSNDDNCNNCDYENDYYLFLYQETPNKYECRYYYEQIQLNYYLEGKRFSYGEYKKCYILCDLCSKNGTIDNQNCHKCINNYYPNLFNKNNCECQKYYSSDDPPICYSNYGLSITYCEYIIREILDKGICVSNCQNTKYKYVYRNQCYEKCPNGTSDIQNNYNCQDNDICSLNEYYTNIPLSLLDSDLKKDIALSYIKEFGNDNKHIKIIYSNDNSYNITLFSNQLCEVDIFLNYLYKLDVSICLEKLKKKQYNNLIIEVISIFKSYELPFEIKTYIYSRINKDSDDLMLLNDLCIDTTIFIYVPMRTIQKTNYLLASELYPTIDIFNKDHPFFNDICYFYQNENNKEIILRDRFYNYYQNYSYCYNNCEEIEKNYSTYEVLCKCNFIEEQNNYIEIKEKSPFDNKLVYFTFDCILCFKNGFGKFFKNYGAIISIILLCIQFVTFICYLIFRKDIIHLYFSLINGNPPKFTKSKQFIDFKNEGSDRNLLQNFKKTLNIEPKNEIQNVNYQTWAKHKLTLNNNSNNNQENINDINNTENINHDINIIEFKNDVDNNNDNNNNSINKNEFEIENKNNYIPNNIVENNNFMIESQLLKNSNLNKETDLNDEEKKIEIEKPKIFTYYNEVKKIVNDDKKISEKPKKLKKYLKILIDIFKDYNIENEEIQFSDALINDISFCKFFQKQIIFKQPLLYVFNLRNPFEPIQVKILILIFKIATICFLNAISFTKKYVSKKYYSDINNRATFYFKNCKYQLLFTCSTFIFINYLLKILQFPERKIIKLLNKYKNSITLRKKLIREFNILILQHLIFGISSILIMIFYVIYIGEFCYVYKRTQIDWLLGIIMTIIIFEIYQIILSFLNCLLRLFSLKIKSECLYNLSYELSY